MNMNRSPSYREFAHRVWAGLGRAGRLSIALGLGGLVLEATPSESRKAILAGLETYNPDIRRDYLSAQEAKKEATAANKTKQAAARQPVQKQPEPISDEAKLVLPDMVVTGEPHINLPRLHAPKPAKQIEAEPFESGEARRARLVKKHFTELEQVLGLGMLRLFNRSLQRRAASREAIESGVRQLNDIAYLIELSDMAGIDDPEEREKLISEYLKASQLRAR